MYSTTIVLQKVQIFLQSQTPDHFSTYQAMCFLDHTIRRVQVPESTLLLCQECLRNTESHLKDKVGFFDLQKRLQSGTDCGLGHRLDDIQEQMFSGISRDFTEFECFPQEETSILGDNLRIQCSSEGVWVKARMAPFELFNEAIQELDGVSNHPIILNLREDIKTKNTFQFGHCPNLGGGLPLPEFF